VLTQTGAAGIMIGRAAQGRIWLPGAIASALAGDAREASAPSIARQAFIHARHVARLHAFYGEYLGPRIARKHQAWFLDALVSQGALDTASAREWRRTFNTIDDTQQQLDQLQQFERMLRQERDRLAA